MPPRTHITAHQLDQDQDLLTELRILSSLRPNDRISTNHAVKPVVRIQKPEILRSFFRFFGSESRASNVAYIQSLLQRVIDRYTAAVQNGDMALQARICEETESAIQGVRRLQQTYEDDAQFQASVNIAIDTVCIHIGICLEKPAMLLPLPRERSAPAAPVKATPATPAEASPSELNPFDYTRLPPAASSAPPHDAGGSDPSMSFREGEVERTHGDGARGDATDATDDATDDDDRSVVETF